MNSESIDDLEPWLALTLVPGVPPGAQRVLLEAHGTAQAVMQAGIDAWTPLVGRDVAAVLAGGPVPALRDKALAWLQQPGHHLVHVGHPAYSHMLANIPDPPIVLYARGKIELLQRKSIAIVGSRNATPQGVRDAHAFASELSHAGICIVSGLAMGIDAAAHRGGLAQRGSSIAVMGTGADRVYPRRNRELATQLANQGCVLSEFALGTPSFAYNFPRRNRIISGLSAGVLVVEAGLPSGSLITARCALEQGRDVFAMPGSIHSALSKGCHDLIKDGAKLVECAADIVDELRISPAPEQDEDDVTATSEVDPLLEAMGFAPMSLDELVHCCGSSVAELGARVARLELEGQIHGVPGGRYQRVIRNG